MLNHVCYWYPIKKALQDTKLQCADAHGRIIFDLEFWVHAHHGHILRHDSINLGGYHSARELMRKWFVFVQPPSVANVTATNEIFG